MKHTGEKCEIIQKQGIVVAMWTSYLCCKLQHIEIQDAKNCQESAKNLIYLILQQRPQNVIWESPLTKICIFLEPSYLPYATTNTAAYKCIALFCNIFLPSGMTVLHVVASWKKRSEHNDIRSQCQIKGCLCDFGIIDIDPVVRSLPLFQLNLDSPEY